ncbi:hypothetical protein CTZ27_31215 [Streptomyces griseocarneus]|nr:hypothetical protein CTZ27_31215 [Streptomyces griseocarneus]
MRDDVTQCPKRRAWRRWALDGLFGAMLALGGSWLFDPDSPGARIAAGVAVTALLVFALISRRGRARCPQGSSRGKIE